MAWLSFGSLAVATTGGGAIRFGLLPRIWLLPLFVVVLVFGVWIIRLSGRAAAPLFVSSLALLPWLPLPVPDSFLLWTGHVAVAIWIGVALATVIAHDVRVPSWFADPKRAPRIAIVVACVLFIFSGIRLAALLPGGDEPHYLIITQSLLKDGDLQIENNHKQGDYREYFSGSLAPDFLRRGTNGQIYSIHAPGLSVVVAPAYALFGYRGVSIFLAAIAAIGTGLLWRACFALSGSAGAAWFGWAAGSLTVPFFFQSFAVYPDGLGAVIVLFAALPLFEGTTDQSKGRWGATGAALALLPWLHTRFALLSVAIGVVLLVRLAASPEDRAHIIAFLAVPAASAAAWLGSFYAIYGTINPAAPYGGYTQSEPANVLNGLPALLFDQQFGILPYAPVYAVCLAGVLGLARRRSRLAIELVAIALPYALATSMYHMWWAGNSSPARFLVVLLPLLAVPGAWVWRETSHPATRAVAMLLLFISIGVTLSLVAVDRGRLAYNFRDGYSLAAERLSAIVDLPRGMPSFFRQSPTGASARALVWIGAMAGAFLVLRVGERQMGRHTRATLALWTPIASALAMMLALTIVWRVDRVSGAAASTSQLDLLSAYDPRIRPTGISVWPPGLESGPAVLEKIAIRTPERRPNPPPNTLLLAPAIIPAGEYELKTAPDRSPVGTAFLIIGRDARPIETWDLALLRERPIRFALPVPVGSLVVTGEGEDARSLGLELAPIRIDGSQPAGEYARRAQQYGPAVVFFFDDGVFPEQPGFWVRGGRTAGLAIAPTAPASPLSLFVRNAPVANRLTLAIDGERQTIDLRAREERFIPLQTTNGRRAARVSLQSDTGFHPAEVEPGSTDNRFLGVWVEVRPRN
jgi:hypothetical protein